MAANNSSGAYADGDNNYIVEGFDDWAWMMADLDTFDAFCSGSINENEIESFKENAYEKYRQDGDR